MSEPISIDMWADIACPWCYIGKRNLERALAELAESDNAPEVRVVFHSFEIAADTPTDYQGGEVEFLTSHKGISVDDAEAMLEHVAGVARAAGLDYRFDLVKHRNTVKAHELVHMARACDLDAQMEERLMHAYFIEGRDLGSIPDLVALAVDVGIEEGAARDALEADTYLHDVRKDEEQARVYGIQGVPFFVIDSQYGISGAQPPEALVGILREVWDKHQNPESESLSGSDAESGAERTDPATA